MTVVVTHTTPSDSSFSATGAAAWDATHTLVGLGTMAEQDANNVTITGGSISGTTISGLGTMSTQNANNVTITGGSISGTTISGLGTMSTQNANNVAITGGSISGVTGIPTGAAVGYTINGSGAVITTGLVGVGLRVPFACTITSATLLADQTGSIVVDIWKDTYANYPPTGADSICASAKPTISASNKSVNTTLTGWTTSIAAGDVLFFNVDSCTTITNCVLVLGVTKT